MVERERKSGSDWNGGVKTAEGRGRTRASEAAVIPHSRISATWQHLRDNTSDPVARFQLAGCVQQLRWKGSHVFTEPQGCLITAWKQEALPATKTGARTHREHQGPAVLSPSLSPAWRARLIFASLVAFFSLVPFHISIHQYWKVSSRPFCTLLLFLRVLQ